jgi:hypothetical protein
VSRTGTQTSFSFTLPPLFCLLDLNASSMLPRFTSWRCECWHKECQNHKIFCFMIGVASATVLHNFLSSFRVASKGYMAIYCLIIWRTIQLRGIFCTIFSVSWVVFMRSSKRYGSVLVRIHLPETYFRMAWNKNVPIGVAFQLCFGLCHEEGTRKQRGNKMTGMRQLLV